MSAYLLKITGLTLALIPASSPVFAEPPSSDSGTAEILQKLQDIQKEVKALRSEMGQLRQAVTEIHRTAVVPPTTAPPPPVTAQVRLEDDDPVLGTQEAAVGMVEFSDYECPFCQRFFTQTFPKLKETYIDTGKVQYVFRDFPLAFHTKAKDAAVAAKCAGKQDAYWKMHNALFANQRRLSPDLYKELAQTLALNVDEFLGCLQQAELASDVDQDTAYGQSLGVRGTPTFFIGRMQDGQLVEAQRISGAQPFSTFAQAIDALLK